MYRKTKGVAHSKKKSYYNIGLQTHAFSDTCLETSCIVIEPFKSLWPTKTLCYDICLFSSIAEDENYPKEKFYETIKYSKWIKMRQIKKNIWHI